MFKLWLVLRFGFVVGGCGFIWVLNFILVWLKGYFLGFVLIFGVIVGVFVFIGGMGDELWIGGIFWGCRLVWIGIGIF